MLCMPDWRQQCPLLPLALSHPALQSIDTYNGSALVAMVGKNCVAIASDRRFGIQAQVC